MPSIGVVTRQGDGSYKGRLQTLSISANIEIVRNRMKNGDGQPDWRVMAGQVELGAGWNRIGEQSGKPYVSLSLAAPEFPQRIYCNLGLAAGEEEGSDVFAVIWNPRD